MNQFKFNDSFWGQVENALRECGAEEKLEEAENIVTDNKSKEEILIDIMDFKKIFSK